MSTQIIGLIVLAAFAGLSVGSNLFRNNITPSARWFNIGLSLAVVASCIYAAYRIDHG